MRMSSVFNTIKLSEFFKKELNLESVQNNLLDQIKVVFAGQTFPIWVESDVCVFLKTRNKIKNVMNKQNKYFAY